MVLVSLVSLFAYLFGAYAYGAATVFALTEVGPAWGGLDRESPPGARPRMDKPGLALFAISTVWFVLLSLIEFRNLSGDNTSHTWLELGTLIVFLFPPVIMHTVYLETCAALRPLARIYGVLLAVMYVVSPLLGVYVIAGIFDLVPIPQEVGPWIGISLGGLFTITSLYAITLMLKRPRSARTPDQARLANVMIFLFTGMSGMFIAMIFTNEQRLIVEILNRMTRAAPLYFLIASVYFENRFAFYDLVVKRAVMILLSVVVLGVYLAATLPWLQGLPSGSVRPWLFAVALVPLAMVMPWVLSRAERWLDRMWLGREFTPVEAVKHVLAAMQPATDERSLIEATEARLSDIFGARITILIGDQEPDGPATKLEVAMPTTVPGQQVRMAVMRIPGGRRILSEDLVMLHSLAGVFGFMLENIRLQSRRQEQDQLAQALRLQSSKSELKALRAQINPHFLFNALNAIASLIHTDPARADEAVEQLAEVFRYTLRRSDSEWAPLDQELTFARAYLDVEQARFGQRLTCTIDSDHFAPPPLIPSMLLQTLLENAVKHGVSQAREPGRIDVIVRTTGGKVMVEVRNTGPRAEQRLPREGEGFGLHSVRERLKGHFGDQASFVLMRDEATGVTIARITMPLVKVAA
jgi:signal transduction histidine kinase